MLLRGNCFDLKPDEPIYRITPVNFLTQDVANSTLTLRRAIGWDDTHEAAYFRRPATDSDTGALVGLEELSKDWFGLCWSRHPESDAMWRIYNSDGMSVRIETTPRLLLNSLFEPRCKLHPSYQEKADLSLYMGGVAYYDGAQFARLMSTPPMGNVLESTGVGIARMLCAKRDPFQHESEVRLLYHAHPEISEFSEPLQDAALMSKTLLEVHAINGRNQVLPGLIHLPFDWGAVSSVMLGPRVSERAAATVRNQVHCALPAARWLESDLYGEPRYPLSM